MKPDDACPVAARFRLPYLAYHEDSEARDKRGEKQTRCATCERWRWSDHRNACPDYLLDHASTESEG